MRAGVAGRLEAQPLQRSLQLVSAGLREGHANVAAHREPPSVFERIGSGFEVHELDEAVLLEASDLPFVERNYNLVELGPRGTGKSYVVQEVSPYSALLTGVSATANAPADADARAREALRQVQRVAGEDYLELDLVVVARRAHQAVHVVVDQLLRQRGLHVAGSQRVRMGITRKLTQFVIGRPLVASDQPKEVRREDEAVDE